MTEVATHPCFVDSRVVTAAVAGGGEEGERYTRLSIAASAHCRLLPIRRIRNDLRNLTIEILFAIDLSVR